MATGKVKWFNRNTNFGFIEDDNGPDVFVHGNNCDGYIPIEGDRVRFDLQIGDKGIFAQNAKPIDVTATNSSLYWRTSSGNRKNQMV